MNSENTLRVVVATLGICFVLGIIAGLVGSTALLLIGQVAVFGVAFCLAVVPILIWREVERMRADATAHAEKLLAAVKAERSRPAPATNTPAPVATHQTHREIESAPVRRVIEIAPP